MGNCSSTKEKPKTTNSSPNLTNKKSSEIQFDKYISYNYKVYTV